MKNYYTYKWIAQRLTALFLIPLSFWFVFQCISFRELNYFELQLFFQSYLNSLLFTLMMFLMLIHAKLGCETIIQDYVSKSSLKKLLNFFINFFTIVSLFLVILAIINMNII